MAACIYFDEDDDLLGSVQVQNKDSPVTEAKSTENGKIVCNCINDNSYMALHVFNIVLL